ncbi:VOC family protein [Mammaliicoccus sciuri]|uniref:VOC family protein n=1 Tax=Mammaliicoccus sciuri TaxID=1296 RepID=UPI001FB314C4|nr:VOC family protein [Mammaliicoccus sciuri]MCJ0920578.1 VOC family protein [Mammaliicoccus sciuri]MCJ0958414.1 VOC family protein [Mammaliicoccus sciuri]MCJ0963425.1 VOC family protein [Mammaliicoccus sciuri]MCJ1777094.1 VOC family protein [Mammaliicoccus sciuri]
MNRVNIITLGVSNIKASLEFYSSLGFEASVVGDENMPDIVFFRVSGSKLALYPIEKLSTETGAELSFTKGGFNGITLAYNVKSEKEVDEVLVKAESLGAKVTSEAVRQAWGGYSGYFTDLDGYMWEVAYGPDWTFDDQDMLII